MPPKFPLAAAHQKGLLEAVHSQFNKVIRIHQFTSKSVRPYKVHSVHNLHVHDKAPTYLMFRLKDAVDHINNKSEGMPTNMYYNEPISKMLI